MSEDFNEPMVNKFRGYFQMFSILSDVSEYFVYFWLEQVSIYIYSFDLDLIFNFKWYLCSILVFKLLFFVITDVTSVMTEEWLSFSFPAIETNVLLWTCQSFLNSP